MKSFFFLIIMEFHSTFSLHQFFKQVWSYKHHFTPKTPNKKLLVVTSKV